MGDAREPGAGLVSTAAEVTTVAELAQLLRQLRRREARQRGDSRLTYRELAAKTGWSRGIVGDYFTGGVLPPIDRFDVLIQLLGATPAEQPALATARDRVEELRRAAATPTDPADAPRKVPRQLPPDVIGFTGRREQLARLDGVLAGCEGASASRVCVLTGRAGIGKSAVAVHWAHRVADRFPDGQLYADFGNRSGRPVTTVGVLAEFLYGLEFRDGALPSDVGELAFRFRTLVAERRMLLLLDDARSAEQVHPLLPGTPSCVVLVTSRTELGGLVAGRGRSLLRLDPLRRAEAVALLRALIGRRVDTEPAAAAALAARCADLPLALRLAAEVATARPTTPLAELARGRL